MCFVSPEGKLCHKPAEASNTRMEQVDVKEQQKEFQALFGASVKENKWTSFYFFSSD